MKIVTIIVTALFVLLSAPHFYWALGGELGIDKAIPENDGKPAMQPGAVVTNMVAVALLGLGAITYLLGFYDLKSMAYGKYVTYCGWFLSGIFVLRAVGDFHLVGFFKKVKSSEFAKYDTRYYSPLCLLLGIVFSILAYSQV